MKVTYDAMTHKQGQSSTADKTFSAIWPEFTGVFVVSVGADGTAIQTNMLMDRMDVGVTKDEQKQLDAEHDILFYLAPTAPATPSLRRAAAPLPWPAPPWVRP